jgi:hypothetical protein
MIRYSRPPEPANFRSTTIEAVKKIQDLIDSNENPKSTDFDSCWTEFANLFVQSQFDKCGYCESSLGVTSGHCTDHYLPKSRVTFWFSNGGQKPFPNGFWWLAYEWSNYVISCYRCNQVKGYRFPVTSPPANVDQNISFPPLLAHPYETIYFSKSHSIVLTPDPSEHLIFLFTGHIDGINACGTLTWEVLDLNRNGLVKERFNLARKIRLAINLVLKDKEPFATFALKKLFEYCQDSAQYAGMARYLVRESMDVDWRSLPSYFG